MTSRPPRSQGRAAHADRPAPSRLRQRARHLPAAALLLNGALLTGAPAAVHAEDLPGCRRIADDQQRLACYDGLAGRLAQETGTTPEELFGLEATTTAERLQRERGDLPVEVLEQAVVAVATDRFGKLRVRLANGQDWEQVDGDRLRLKPGDAVRIRRAALGSYLLALESGGRAIRVRRVADPAAPD